MTNKAALREEFMQGSWALAEALRPQPGEAFTLRSKSRDKSYEMVVTPEGYVVHQDEGCEGELFNGPLGCWHSKTGRKLDMTTAMTQYDAGAVTVRTITQDDVDVLKTTICRGATDAELNLFVATCKHTGLDPFMKQIHAVFRNTNVGSQQNPKWEKVMSIQVGIDGYRLIAERTGMTQGMEGPQWSDDGKKWLDYPMSDTPRFARVGIYRKGVERPFVAVCRWAAYAQYQGQNLTSMWKKMGPEQLAKCAEALALRRAYPAEMANLPLAPDYVDDEEVQMERQSFVPSPHAIEGELAAPADLDDEVPGAYEDEHLDPQQQAEEETYIAERTASHERAAAVPSFEETTKAIVTALTDCKETWSGQDYLKLYNDLKQFMPEGVAKFDYTKLTAETAPACLAFLRERRGEPKPTS